MVVQRCQYTKHHCIMVKKVILYYVHLPQFLKIRKITYEISFCKQPFIYPGVLSYYYFLHCFSLLCPQAFEMFYNSRYFSCAQCFPGNPPFTALILLLEAWLLSLQTCYMETPLTYLHLYFAWDSVSLHLLFSCSLLNLSISSSNCRLSHLEMTIIHPQNWWIICLALSILFPLLFPRLRCCFCFLIFCMLLDFSPKKLLDSSYYL